MPLFGFDVGDVFSCVDVFDSECMVFGVVLGDHQALIIRGNGANVQFSIQRTRLPHAAESMETSGRSMPSEVRLALDAVIIALSLPRRTD